MTNLKSVPKNDDSKNNNNYSLQLNRWFLKPIGAWPQTNTSGIVWKILVLLHIFTCLIIVALIMIPCTLYVLLEENDIKLKLSAIGPLMHRIMGSVNYWTLLTRSNDIRDCIQHMETDWRLIQRIEDRNVMLQHAKFGRSVAGICGVIMHGGTFLFSIAKAIKTTTVTVDNETFTMHPMTCPIYSKIIDIRFSPVNEIALVIQFLSTFIASCATVGGCSLAAVFAMHACGQLNVLYTWLHELDSPKEGNHVAKQKIATIVKHHLRVLNFISRIESIMNKVSLAELVGCTISMCLVGYYSIMVC
ncbi:uncharacterized protein [Anoplolepis gracilipes]|uniref:uncharacterized protein n=1 Tax=Anoplolepis gracilipes TaxID=354296 RepID=UPI003BA3B36A